MSLLATLASVLIAALGLLVAYRTFRKQNPKRRLLISVRSSRLMQGELADLEIRYKGELLAVPHLVSIEIRSLSRADIPTHAFDAGRATLLKLDRQLRVLNVDSVGIEVTSTGEEVRIPPQLIKVDAGVTIDGLTEGRAKVDIYETLIDVQVVRVDEGRRGNFLPTALAIMAGAMAVGVVTLLVGSWVFRIF